MIKGEVRGLYPTPVYVTPTINNFDSVQKEVLEAESEAEYSYNGDWDDTHYLSGLDGNVIHDENLREFAKELAYHVNVYCTNLEFPGKRFMIESSWFSKFDRGNYAHLHNHGATDVSGVYYVKVPDGSSNIFFEPTNRHLETSEAFAALAKREELKANVGMLVLFPGWLQHGVRTNDTDDSRVSMSFNINFTEPL